MKALGVALVVLGMVVSLTMPAAFAQSPSAPGGSEDTPVTSADVIATQNQGVEDGGGEFRALLPFVIIGFGSRPIRLYEDAQRTRLLYEYVAGRVYAGSVEGGVVMLFFDGAYVYEGAGGTGEKLFRVDGNHIRACATPHLISYTIEENHVLKGTDQELILYTFRGEDMLGGDGSTGELILRADRSLETGRIRFLLPILRGGE